MRRLIDSLKNSLCAEPDKITGFRGYHDGQLDSPAGRSSASSCGRIEAVTWLPAMGLEKALLRKIGVRFSDGCGDMLR
jgi:hypothetical protein